MVGFYPFPPAKIATLSVLCALHNFTLFFQLQFAFFARSRTWSSLQAAGSNVTRPWVSSAGPMCFDALPNCARACSQSVNAPYQQHRPSFHPHSIDLLSGYFTLNQSHLAGYWQIQSCQKRLLVWSLGAPYSSFLSYGAEMSKTSQFVISVCDLPTLEFLADSLLLSRST